MELGADLTQTFGLLWPLLIAHMVVRIMGGGFI
jgi:hypothetical protein